MSDLRQCTREFLTEFIELYQSLPFLWRVKCKEYSDRDKKTQAYEALVSKYMEVDPSATRETVTKKINSMRSVYRKELAKVNKSIHSGMSDDEVYKPSLWYFDLLGFLNDQKTPRPSKNTMDDEEEDSQVDDAIAQSEGDADEFNDEMPDTPATPSSSTKSYRAPASGTHSTYQSHVLERGRCL
ncbi:hypothetical protein FQR65_LT03050 [Abscondita terminalis]|nr:hypothetical protein FQR65_LT03050 [Abscondita terminalis]